jgi:hypothetical protein
MCCSVVIVFPNTCILFVLRIISGNPGMLMPGRRRWNGQADVMPCQLVVCFRCWGVLDNSELTVEFSNSVPCFLLQFAFWYVASSVRCQSSDNFGVMHAYCHWDTRWSWCVVWLPQVARSHGTLMGSKWSWQEACMMSPKTKCACMLWCDSLTFLLSDWSVQWHEELCEWENDT